MPSPNIVIKDIPDLVLDKDDEDEEPYISDDALEEGDRIFIATIPCEAEFIQATSNILQQLTEAFHKNAEPKSFHESVPTHLRNFKDLFSKSLFNRLPDRKVWDHGIELILGTKQQTARFIPLHIMNKPKWT